MNYDEIKFAEAQLGEAKFNRYKYLCTFIDKKVEILIDDIWEEVDGMEGVGFWEIRFRMKSIISKNNPRRLPTYIDDGEYIKGIREIE